MFRTYIKVIISFVLLPLLSFPYNSWANKVKQGTVVFSSAFSAKGRVGWSKIKSAHWVPNNFSNDTCLLINGTGMIDTAIDLSPYRGMKLLFRCRVKAENVTQPSVPSYGIKFMLHYKSGGREHWQGEDNIYGTFDRKELAFSMVIPNDIVQSVIALGLYDCSGKAWFDSLAITVIGVPLPSKPYHPHRAIHSSTRFRGVMYPMRTNEEPMKTLSKEWSANLVRLEICMNHAEAISIDADITKYNQWFNKQLHKLDSILVLCHKYRVKAILRIDVPGGYKNGIARLFYNKDCNDYFISIWQQIAKKYTGNKNIFGYDLINEPIQDYHLLETTDYYQTQLKAAKAIRNFDKKTPIIFEVDGGDAPPGFAFLTPLPMSNIIYEVHMYRPHTFTHQGVHNTVSGIIYPGIIDGKYYDKAELKKILQPVRDFQLAYHVPIFVGEFSAARWAPGAAKYLDDCISIFEEYGWDWTYHAFREWDGWDVECENGTSKIDHAKRATQNTDRKTVLLKWLAKNKKK